MKANTTNLIFDFKIFLNWGAILLLNLIFLIPYYELIEHDWIFAKA